MASHIDAVLPLVISGGKHMVCTHLGSNIWEKDFIIEVDNDMHQNQAR